MRTALIKEGWVPIKRVKNAVEFLTFDFENGISPSVSSNIYYGMTGEGTDVIVTDKRGYPYIPRRMARRFRHKIRLNTIVTKIDYSKEKVEVSTEGGEAYTTDYVLVTFSSGVFINSIVNFVPTLPSWKTDAIAMIPMGHYCKVFLKFPQKFWDDNNYNTFCH